MIDNLEGGIALFIGIPSLKVFTWVVVVVAFLVHKVKTRHLNALGKAVSTTCHHFMAEYPEKFTFLIVYYVAAILALIYVKGGFTSSKAESDSPSEGHVEATKVPATSRLCEERKEEEEDIFYDAEEEFKEEKKDEALKQEERKEQDRLVNRDDERDEEYDDDDEHDEGDEECDDEPEEERPDTPQPPGQQATTCSVVKAAGRCVVWGVLVVVAAVVVLVVLDTFLPPLKEDAQH